MLNTVGALRGRSGDRGETGTEQRGASCSVAASGGGVDHVRARRGGVAGTTTREQALYGSMRDWKPLSGGKCITLGFVRPAVCTDPIPAAASPTPHSKTHCGNVDARRRRTHLSVERAPPGPVSGARAARAVILLLVPTGVVPPSAGGPDLIDIGVLLQDDATCLGQRLAFDPSKSLRGDPRMALSHR